MSKNIKNLKKNYFEVAINTKLRVLMHYKGLQNNIYESFTN